LDTWWVTLLRAQQSDGFADLAGADVSMTLPVSDRLLSTLIAQRLPRSAPIRDFDLIAHAGDEIAVRVRLAKPAFLPAIQVRLAIVQQAVLPHAPTIVLEMVSQGMAALAGNALRFVDALPPGVRFDGRRIFVDLAEILRRQNAAELLTYLTDLQVTTTEHRLIVRARLRVPDPS
jgi:hypothetical protein